MAPEVRLIANLLFSLRIRFANNMSRADDNILTIGEAIRFVCTGDRGTWIHSVEVTKTDNSTTTLINMPVPCFEKPYGLTLFEWLKHQIDDTCGVLSCIAGYTAVSFSKEICAGAPEFWMYNLIKYEDIFNVTKTRTSSCNHSWTFEFNSFYQKAPPFMADGESYGLQVGETDKLFDAGISVTVRSCPYATNADFIKVDDYTKRISLCVTEIAYLLEMAERTVAPCVMACFFTRQMNSQQMLMNVGTQPTAITCQNTTTRARGGEITGIVTIRQISTFTLSDLMSSINVATLHTRRMRFVRLLRDACPRVFSTIRKMAGVHNGRALVKLNMTPDTVVFCPELTADGKDWRVDGIAYMPTSKDFLDGVPKLVDFNAVFSTRISKKCMCLEVSYIMHSVLLVACTRAKYGKYISDVLLDFLTNSISKDLDGIKSRPAAATAFLQAVLDDKHFKTTPGVEVATAEVVDFMHNVVSTGAISRDFQFDKLTSILTRPPQTSKFVGASTSIKNVTKALRALAVNLQQLHSQTQLDSVVQQ